MIYLLRYSAILILLSSMLLSCKGLKSLSSSEEQKITSEVTNMLYDYHEAIREDGLRAEFDYLDNSEDFFWIPPGYQSALKYDSVYSILDTAADGFSSVDFRWKTLEVKPISKNVATFSGIVNGGMIDTLGIESFVTIIESGIIVKRTDGWKLLSGQSSNVELQKPNIMSNKSFKSIVQTPTNALAESLDFYKSLNFKVVSEANPTLVTDGGVIIEINPDRFARAGVKIYSTDWSEVVEEMKEIVAVSNMDNGYYFADPSGTLVYLIEGMFNHDIEKSDPTFSALGNYAGVSLETTDIAKSIRIWTLLGFKKTMGSAEQGWIVYGDDNGFGVSLMKVGSCPHLFFNPSLTYFNGSNNLKVIAEIRNKGIPITEEISHFNKEGIVDNIIIRDPGGFGFFLFSD